MTVINCGTKCIFSIDGTCRATAIDMQVVCTCGPDEHVAQCDIPTAMNLSHYYKDFAYEPSPVWLCGDFEELIKNLTVLLKAVKGVARKEREK